MQSIRIAYYKMFITIGSVTYSKDVSTVYNGKEININVVGNPVNGAMVNFTVIAVNRDGVDSIPTIADKATVVWVVPFSGEA
jgi:predicted thioesterase